MKRMAIDYGTKFKDLNPFFQIENIFNTEEEKKGRFVFSGRYLVDENRLSGALEEIKNKGHFVISIREIA